MLNLTIKLSRNDVKEFTYVLMCLNKLSYELDPEDYCHFYNIRSLYKRSNDKQFALSTTRQKNVSFKININEFESLKYIYFTFIEGFKQPNFIFYGALLDTIIMQLDAQQKSLLRLDQFYIFSQTNKGIE